MIVAEKNVAAGLALDENVPSGLDWHAFSAAYFPGSRRHNLKAIVAYGAYRRSSAAGQQRASEAAGFKPDAINFEAIVGYGDYRRTSRRPSGSDAASLKEAVSTDAESIGDWENEGGVSPDRSRGSSER